MFWSPSSSTIATKIESRFIVFLSLIPFQTARMSFHLHRPSFGYPISRPLPYTWFSWVVVIGGICSIVLFSLINFAANGYELAVVYDANPNSTVAQHLWSEHRPFSWFNKLSPSCQRQNFQVNSQIFTDKLSLPHVITGIFQNETADGKHKNLTVLPSLQYMNHVLKNCTINQMLFELEKSSRTANQQTTLKWGIEASVLGPSLTDYFHADNLGQAYSTCYVENGQNITWVNLTTKFDYIQPTVTSNQGYRGTGFLQLDEQNKTCLWWGQSLL